MSDTSSFGIIPEMKPSLLIMMYFKFPIFTRYLNLDRGNLYVCFVFVAIFAINCQ